MLTVEVDKLRGEAVAKQQESEARHAMVRFVARRNWRYKFCVLSKVVAECQTLSREVALMRESAGRHEQAHADALARVGDTLIFCAQMLTLVGNTVQVEKEKKVLCRRLEDSQRQLSAAKEKGAPPLAVVARAGDAEVPAVCTGSVHR